MELEWLVLADAAQVVGGKLYLLGGGWDFLMVNSGFPAPQHCAVAAAFRVPWNETNQRHHVDIRIEDDDGQELVSVGGEVEVGRPPGIPVGHEQRVQLAVDLTIEFQKPGGYVIIARVEGREMRRVPFTIISTLPTLRTA